MLLKYVEELKMWFAYTCTLHFAFFSFLAHLSMKCLKVSSCDQSLSVCHIFLLAQSGIFLPWSLGQGPVEFGKRTLDYQNWEILMQSKRTGLHFKWIKKYIWNKKCKAFVTLVALLKKFMKICIKMWMKTCFHSHFYANFHASVTLLFLLGFFMKFSRTNKLGMINTILGGFC